MWEQRGLCLLFLINEWFSSQSVPLSLQLLQAPDRGPGWCLQQGLRGCRSKSKVSVKHQVSDLCLLVVHHWNSQKTPSCSLCNNTKELKKERFLLCMEEFSSWCLPGSPHEYGDGSPLVSAQSQAVPRSCSITIFESSGPSINPLEMLWGEKLQILGLH